MIHALYRAIRHELGAKVFAILAALSLWVYVMNTEDPVRRETVACPVQVTNTPPGLHVAKTTPESVRVEVSARLSELHNAPSSALRVIADAAGKKAGNNTVRLQVAGAPERVMVLGVEPPSAQVWLDRRVTDSFRPVAAISGSPAPGFEVWGPIALQPGRVTVACAAATLPRVAKVIARVTAENLSATQSVRVELEAVDDRGAQVRRVTIEPSAVQATIPIAAVTSRQVTVQARLGDPPAGYAVTRVKVRPATVTLKGAPDALRDVTRIYTRRLDLSGLRGTETLTGGLAPPAGTVVAGRDGSVSVQVTIAPRAPGSTDGSSQPSDTNTTPPDDAASDGQAGDASPATPTAPASPDDTSPGEAPGRDSTSPRTPEPDGADRTSRTDRGAMPAAAGGQPARHRRDADMR